MFMRESRSCTATSLPRRNINRSCFAYDGWSILLQLTKQLQRESCQRKGTTPLQVWSRDEHPNGNVSQRSCNPRGSHCTYTIYQTDMISTILLCTVYSVVVFFFWKDARRTVVSTIIHRFVTQITYCHDIVLPKRWMNSLRQVCFRKETYTSK